MNIDSHLSKWLLCRKNSRKIRRCWKDTSLGYVKVKNKNESITKSSTAKCSTLRLVGIVLGKEKDVFVFRRERKLSKKGRCKKKKTVGSRIVEYKQTQNWD